MRGGSMIGHGSSDAPAGEIYRLGFRVTSASMPEPLQSNDQGARLKRALRVSTRSPAGTDGGGGGPGGAGGGMSGSDLLGSAPNLLDWADKMTSQGIASITQGMKSLLGGGHKPAVARALDGEEPMADDLRQAVGALARERQAPPLPRGRRAAQRREGALAGALFHRKAPAARRGADGHAQGRRRDGVEMRL